MAENEEDMGVPASPSLSHPFGAEPVPVSGKAGIANAALLTSARDTLRDSASTLAECEAVIAGQGRIIEALRSDLAKGEPVAQCEGCQAPLFFDDDYVGDPDGCYGCWAAMTDFSSKRERPCYAYRVGKPSAASAAGARERQDAEERLGPEDARAARSKAKGDAQPPLVSKDQP